MKSAIFMSSLAITAGQRLVRGHDVRRPRNRQGATLSATHHGPAQRCAKAARRADHEDFKRWDRRTLQSADAQSCAGSAAVRSVPLSALGNFSPDQAQRVCNPHYWPAMALAGRMVRARAAGGESGPQCRYHRGTKGQQRPSNMAEDEAVVYDFVTELTTTQKVSDETYARAKKMFNDQQIVDLTGVGRQLHHGGDDAGDGGRDRAARQGAAVQGWGEVSGRQWPRGSRRAALPRSSP